MLVFLSNSCFQTILKKMCLNLIVSIEWINNRHLYIVLQVNRILKVLEEPYSDASGLQSVDRHNTHKQTFSYDQKPPAWAQTICVT